jgi:thiamine biosynthesis lipoprotein
MGTTYRVTLKAHISDKALGEVHRQIDQLLQQIDLSLSTWRDDSLVTKINRAQARTPIPLDHHLTNAIGIAGRLYQKTQGRFDITAAPLIQWWKHAEVAQSPHSTGCHHSAAPPKVTDLVGFDHLLIEKADDSKYPTLQKTHTATAIDFSGMGAGYAVDQIGETLVSLGSTAHLVELGGEVRAWGQPSLVEEWHVALRTTETKPPEIIVLHHGQAVAVSRSVRGKRTVHPTTGEIVKLPSSAPAVVAYAATCAEADALATAHVLDGTRKATQDSSSVIQ